MSQDLQDAIQRLFDRHRLGIRPGLDATRDLLARLGDPHTACGMLHVAGTNGKGSVCAMLEAMLIGAGYRVGFYSSPHLIRFNERFRVGGRSVEDDELGPLVLEVEQAAESVERDTARRPTFFECATAIALEHFRRRGVQLVVLETGMGGRLDATNVVRPLVSAITRISLEHTASLGDTVAAIAREKAGIVKPGRPVVCGAMPEEAEQVVRAIAESIGSPFVAAREAVTVTARKAGFLLQKVRIDSTSAAYGAADLPLIGAHQLENLATAVAVLDTLRDVVGLEVDPSAAANGLSKTYWPGRMQALSEQPPTILDGAHNPGAGAALAAALKPLLGRKPLGLVVGMFRDKDMHTFLRPFQGLARRLWAVPIDNSRNRPPEEIAEEAARLGMQAEASELKEALLAARQWAAAQGAAVCITGSLYLAGEVLALWPTLPPDSEGKEPDR